MFVLLMPVEHIVAEILVIVMMEIAVDYARM